MNLHFFKFPYECIFIHMRWSLDWCSSKLFGQYSVSTSVEDSIIIKEIYSIFIWKKSIFLVDFNRTIFSLSSIGHKLLSHKNKTFKYIGLCRYSLFVEGTFFQEEMLSEWLPSLLQRASIQIIMVHAITTQGRRIHLDT